MILWVRSRISGPWPARLSSTSCCGMSSTRFISPANAGHCARDSVRSSTLLLCQVECDFYAASPLAFKGTRWPRRITGPGSDGRRPNALVRIVARPATPSEPGQPSSASASASASASGNGQRATASGNGDAGSAPALFLDLFTPPSSLLAITPEDALLARVRSTPHRAVVGPL